MEYAKTASNRLSPAGSPVFFLFIDDMIYRFLFGSYIVYKKGEALPA